MTQIVGETKHITKYNSSQLKILFKRKDLIKRNSLFFELSTKVRKVKN